MAKSLLLKSYSYSSTIAEEFAKRQRGESRQVSNKNVRFRGSISPASATSPSPKLPKRSPRKRRSAGVGPRLTWGTRRECPPATATSSQPRLLCESLSQCVDGTLEHTDRTTRPFVSFFIAKSTASDPVPLRRHPRRGTISTETGAVATPDPPLIRRQLGTNSR